MQSIKRYRGDSFFSLLCFSVREIEKKEERRYNVDAKTEERLVVSVVLDLVGIFLRAQKKEASK